MNNQAAQTMPLPIAAMIEQVSTVENLIEDASRQYHDSTRWADEPSVYDDRSSPTLQEAIDAGFNKLRDMLRDYAAALSRTAGVPEGWVLVPARMELTPENMAALAFMLGGDPDAKDSDERWNGGTLWVGETIGDHGEKYYGLNVANVECYEEGSIPIVEFAAAPAAQQTAGVVLARGWFHALPDEDDYEFHDDANGAGKNCDGCIRAMIVAAPAASGVDTSTNEAWATRAQEKIAAMDAASWGALSSNPNLVTPSLSSESAASVSERARELLVAECPECGGSNGYMVPAGEHGGAWQKCSTCQDGERLNSVSRYQALRALEQALTQQRGHGTTGSMEQAEKATFVPCDCGCGRSCCAMCGNDVGFLTPQPSADAVREVIGSMRNFADVADKCELTEGNAQVAIRAWATQLESLLSGGSHA